MFNISSLFHPNQHIHDLVCTENEYEIENHGYVSSSSSSSGSYNSSSNEETDSRFMDENEASFITLHLHQRVSVVNQNLFPTHVLDKGNFDDISQVSLDFGENSSIESSVLLNSYGATAEQIEIATRWRRNAAESQFNQENNSPRTGNINQRESAFTPSAIPLSPAVRETSHFRDVFEEYIKRPSTTMGFASGLPPPPPPSFKKKFSGSQFQISPKKYKSKMITVSNQELRPNNVKPKKTIEEDSSSNYVQIISEMLHEQQPLSPESSTRYLKMPKAPRKAKKYQASSSLPIPTCLFNLQSFPDEDEDLQLNKSPSLSVFENCFQDPEHGNIEASFQANVYRKKTPSKCKNRKMQQLKRNSNDLDATMPLSESDGESAGTAHEQMAVFEPFDDNIAVEDLSMTHSESFVGLNVVKYPISNTQNQQPHLETSLVTFENSSTTKTIHHASTIIQSTYRGWVTRYHILSDLGIAKRRHWQKKTKSQNVTRLHSSIRREARRNLSAKCKFSMILAVRDVCASRIQRWWRSKITSIRKNRDMGFDHTLLPGDWYTNVNTSNFGIPFFHDDFESIIGMNATRLKKIKPSVPSTVSQSKMSLAYDRDYYKRANKNLYEDDADDNALIVPGDADFIASISLLPKIFGGIVGRFVKIFKKKKKIKDSNDCGGEKTGKRRFKIFKREKQIIQDDSRFEKNYDNSSSFLQDTYTLYRPLEDDNIPGVALTSSYDSVPFDEL